MLHNLFSCFFAAPSPTALTAKKVPAIHLHDGLTSTTTMSGQKLNDNKRSKSWRLTLKKRFSSRHLDTSSNSSGVASESTSTMNTKLSIKTDEKTINPNNDRKRAKSKSTGSLMTSVTQQQQTQVMISTHGFDFDQQQQNMPDNMSQTRSPPKVHFHSRSKSTPKVKLSLSTTPVQSGGSKKRIIPPGQSQFVFEEHTSQTYSKRHVNETFMDWIQTTKYYAKIEESMKKK